MTNTLKALTGIYCSIMLGVALTVALFITALLPFALCIYYSPSHGWALVGMLIVYPPWLYGVFKNLGRFVDTLLLPTISKISTTFP